MVLDFTKAQRQVVVDRYVLKKVVQAIHNPGMRMQWDHGNIEEIKLIKAINKNSYCIYQKNKAPKEEMVRFFFEKKLIFSVKDGGINRSKGEPPKIYVYLSEVPEKEVFITCVLTLYRLSESVPQ